MYYLLMDVQLTGNENHKDFMQDYQFWTLVTLLMIGFGWIISILSSLDKSNEEALKRLRTIETYLSLFPSPLSIKTEEIKDKE